MIYVFPGWCRNSLRTPHYYGVIINKEGIETKPYKTGKGCPVNGDSFFRRIYWI